jgi:hypothetical protein
VVVEKPKGNTAADGLRARAAANKKRALAREFVSSDPVGARWYDLESDEHEGHAAEILTLPGRRRTGTGGELHLSECAALEKPGLADTVESPNLVTAEASLGRLELAADAGCLALAADAAETIGAGNSLEKMLAH